jgi:hypothetical protein
VESAASAAGERSTVLAQAETTTKKTGRKARGIVVRTGMGAVDVRRPRIFLRGGATCVGQSVD